MQGEKPVFGEVRIRPFQLIVQASAKSGTLLVLA
jgi:hypothetical protein